MDRSTLVTGDDGVECVEVAWQIHRQGVPVSDPRPVLTPDDWSHVLKGHPVRPRLGGHRYGTDHEGKTEFPRLWSGRDIRMAVEVTLADPHWSRVIGDRRILRRLVRGVIVECSYFVEVDAPPMFRAAFPRSGFGVVQNVAGQKVARPLDLSSLAE
jgi:hypothetical protein